MVPLLVSLRRPRPSDEVDWRLVRDQLAFEGFESEDRCPFEVRRGRQLLGHHGRLRSRRGPLQACGYPSAGLVAAGNARLALNHGAGVGGHHTADVLRATARVASARVPTVLAALDRRMV